MSRVLLALVFLLSGCTQTAAPDAPINTEAPDCLFEPRPQSHSMQAGGHHINTPTGGYMSSGVYHDFRLSRPRSALQHVNVTLTWEPEVLGQERLRLDFQNETDGRPFQRFEGASPLHGAFDVDGDTPLGNKLRVHIGTVSDNSPLPASKSLVDQEVTIQVQQTYRC